MERLIHSRRGAGLQPGTSPQLFSFVLFCFLTAAHSLDGGKKRKKKKKAVGGSQLKHLKVKSGKCLWGRGRPLLKRARREIRRHSRLGDCPGVWRFQKAAPRSRFPRRGERAGTGLAPEPCRLARNRHACPGSRRSLPSPQFFVANADGSPRRLFFFFFTFSSPSSSPAPPSLAFPFGSREASAVALDRRAKRAEKKKSLSP